MLNCFRPLRIGEASSSRSRKMKLFFALTVSDPFESGKPPPGRSQETHSYKELLSFRPLRIGEASSRERNVFMAFSVERFRPLRIGEASSRERSMRIRLLVGFLFQTPSNRGSLLQKRK